MRSYSRACVGEVSAPIKITLVVLFALLWAVWMQPHTIALRQILLVAGSILGLYVISQNLHLFKTKLAFPVYIVGLLFVWVTFHLFFLSHQYELQLIEYFSIWKRMALSMPFAIGLGIALGGSNHKNYSSRDNCVVNRDRAWWVFYAGIVAPTVIYLVRTLLVLLASKFGWNLPNFAIKHPPTSDWHITKMNLEFFCLPALAMACGHLIYIFSKTKQIKNSAYLYFLVALDVATIAAVFFVFYLENAKNGMAYSTFFVLIMLLIIILDKKIRWNWRNAIFLLASIIAMIFLIAQHVQDNDSWKTLFADIKVAQHLEQTDAWKNYGVNGYPINEFGKEVSGTNYLRAAWALVALQLIGEEPLGYGLVFTSFGHMAQERWPDSTLFQAHSAWLDLTLGIGIPGIFLLILSGLLALKNAWTSSSKLWSLAAIWIVLSISMEMLTTEFTHKIYIDPLMFLILWAAGLGLSKLEEIEESNIPLNSECSKAK